MRPGALLALVLCLSGVAGAARAQPLEPPWVTDEVRALSTAPVRPVTCTTPPPAVIDLAMDGFYVDAAFSRIDPAAYARYQAAERPILDYERELRGFADRHLRSRAPGAADCAHRWLDGWAAAGAMLGTVTQQGGYVRKWMLGAIAANHLKLRDAEPPEPLAAARVRGWLARWATTVRDDYETRTERASRRNNHLNWAAWSVLIAGVTLDDRALFDWGVAKYRQALREVDAEGHLPLELARGSKASHYHLFALSPLVMIAETGARNGLDLHGAEGGALHRLFARTVAGLLDPSLFAARTGQAQEFVGPLNGDKLAALIPYLRRFPDQRATTMLRAHERFSSRHLGGDLAALFGRP